MNKKQLKNYINDYQEYITRLELYYEFKKNTSTKDLLKEAKDYVKFLKKRST